MIPTVNIEELRGKVKTMYQQVAEDPKGEFHFEMGRALAQRLGYPSEDLDRIPAEAIESFAGVGYYFDLAALREGERVLDLGSGSGMDAFFAALKVSPRGHVTGLDMTDEQLKKAETLARRHGVENLSFVKGFIEELPLDSAHFDVVISNGVINLSAEKDKVFKEIARVLKPGGRMAIADIVTEKQLSENIVCDSSLWAACIGGAAQQERYRELIEEAGLKVLAVKENPQYRFLSKSAQGASKQFGVKSVSLLAKKSS
jgi:ubiquinone/menaquinone biosynthesis C-methylase UbiE